MQLALALSLCAGGAAPWTPAALGASLLGWWDAEDASTITQSGGLVSSWRDKVAGYDTTQATGASKPVYSATSFNNRPGISFDGVDDFLNLESVSLPSGAVGCEIWALADQTALAADPSLRCVFSYGGNGGNNSRRSRRNPGGGTNVADGVVGDGASFATPTVAGDYSGKRITRIAISPTASTAEIDGAAGTPVAVVPATGTTRVRIGASPADVAAQFFQGPVSAILVTSILSAAQAAQLYAYLNPRKA